MKNGFSLIELIIVIAVILVLGTASAVFYSRFLNQNSVANASDSIVGELRKAQMYSMAGKQDSSWGVKWGSNTITLFATRSASFDETVSVPSVVTITGFTQVIFAKPTGTPDVPTTGTISDSKGNTKTFTISSQGMISR